MKYSFQFKSHNDDAETFTLTFEVVGAKRFHIVLDPQVYQHRGDLFCTVAKRECSPHHYNLTVSAISSPFQFSIDIYINDKGCEIFVIEKVITTITHANITPNR